MDARVSELLAWEIETHKTLPLPAGVIVALEDAGGAVDLDTGAVLDVAGDVFDVTVVCEAWHVVTQHEAAP